MGNRLENLNKELAETTNAIQVSSEALAQADADLAFAKIGLKDDTHYVHDASHK